MKTVRVPRTVEGEVSALIVHGNDLCGAFYAPLAAGLAARGLDVDLVTLPGFHREPAYARPAWSRYAEDIAAAVTALPGKPVLIGHSMGGFMALLAAARIPDALHRLVLVEPAIYPHRFMAQTGSATYLKRVVRADRGRFVNSTGFMPRVHDLATFPRPMIDLYLEVRQTSDVNTMEALFRELPDLYPLPFTDVRAQTLLLSGAHIGLRGKALTWMIRRKIPRLTHAVIPRAAHWVVNEADAALTDRIAAFV